MERKRSGFLYFALIVYSTVILYAIVCGIGTLGNQKEYPDYDKGILLLCIMGLGICLLVFGVLWARLGMTRRVAEHPRFAFWLENGLATAVLCASTFLRVRYVQTIPMEPQSDYKTYYEIAQMLNSGTLLTSGTGYCDYISLFPHVLGYPKILSVVFRLFGDGVLVAQYFNVALAVGTAFAAWRIARRLSGRIGGFVTLCTSAFWPSQILYGNFVASEYPFTFLMMCCTWLFVASLQDFDETAAHPWHCVLELMALGGLLAYSGTIRPLAVIFLIAILLYLLRGTMTLPARLKNDIPLGMRLISDGWKRCLVVLLAYLLFSGFFSLGTAYTVDRKIASGTASFGYNLMVGLNTHSDGGWNQQDADYLNDAFNDTGSATEAQIACRDVALNRLTQNPKAVFNLMLHKFELLWGNDDYGASTNILFLDQLGNLTPQREAFLYNMMIFSDFYYVIMLILSGVLGAFLWRKKPNASYALILFFLGTVTLHLLVETQNRYHFHVLTLFAIFAGMTVSYINQACYESVMASKAREEKIAAERAEREKHLRALEAEEKRLMRLRSEAMHARFDIEKALREGHVGIMVTEAAAKPEKTEEYTASRDRRENLGIKRRKSGGIDSFSKK
ncbi:MAG: hypothetical protein ACFWUC_05985 [Oscillospiraceae bacterium]|jgi:hypothetical protein